MTKRNSSFERAPRDFYPTPEAAVTPLLSFLNPNTVFIEPCAGDGSLVSHLNKHGHICSYACDIEPQAPYIDKQNSLEIDRSYLVGGDYIITNPPWERQTLHAMVEKFQNIRPTWLLFDTDWFFTKQAQKYKPHCHFMVTVGRVKWIPGTKSVGFDNCAWYLFDGSYETGYVKAF